MISFLLLLVLVWGFYIGYRRGLLLQVYYLISAMASAFMAGQVL
ncbi:CvpA family protein [Streptococcus pneumoniae]|nr:CvpA family protein [Streptococcus pneumoniae]